MTQACIGIGNLFRRDDGAGIVASRMLRQRVGDTCGVCFCEESGEGVRLMDAWRGFDRIVLIDAVMAQGHPGRIYHIAAGETQLPTDFFKYSSHAFSLAEAVEMGRVLGSLPPDIQVYGIEGEDFGFGEGLSPAVETACRQLAVRLCEL